MMNNLNAKQREIATLAAKGMLNKEIAELLNIKFKTVRWHIEQIYKKCGVRNRAELTYEWLSECPECGFKR